MNGEDRGFPSSVVAMAFLMGGMVGAGLALLLAPQSGRETREKLLSVANEARDKGLQLAEELKEKLESGIEQGREILGEKRSILSSAVEAGREALERERERLTAKKQ